MSPVLITGGALIVVCLVFLLLGVALDAIAQLVTPAAVLGGLLVGSLVGVMAWLQLFTDGMVG